MVRLRGGSALFCADLVFGFGGDEFAACDYVDDDAHGAGFADDSSDDGAKRWRVPDDQAESVVGETLEQIRAIVSEIDVLPEIRKLVVERIDHITGYSGST